MTLKLAQIEKRYGDRVLLSIESLEIDRASCILITGENGAGKTTLLQILAGLLEPERCWVTDQDATVSWRKARAKFLRMVVYVHQTAYIFDRTVAENVAYGLKARKVPKEQIEHQVADALRWARLDHLAYRNARLLSDGEKQRIALTRAKVVGKKILALDEPTANLDRRSRNQVYEMIEELRDEGKSILVASHDLPPLESICDQHWQLQSGRLVSQENYREAWLRKDNIRLFPNRKV